MVDQTPAGARQKSPYLSRLQWLEAGQHSLNEQSCLRAAHRAYLAAHQEPEWRRVLKALGNILHEHYGIVNGIPVPDCPTCLVAKNALADYKEKHGD